MCHHPITLCLSIANANRSLKYSAAELLRLRVSTLGTPVPLALQGQEFLAPPPRPRYIHRGSGRRRTQTKRQERKHGADHSVLRPVQRDTTNNTTTPTCSSISFALLNCHSLNNKSPIISELLLDNHIDLLLLCETWQQPQDFYALNQAIPSHYTYIANPRLFGRGGGVAVLHKKSLSITQLHLNLPTFSSFEYLAFSLPNSVTSILIYRPPTSHPSFLSELSELLTLASTLSSRLLLTGDFNVHVDRPNDPLTRDFLSLLDSFHITQHVDFPTHNKGHTLDLVCSSYILSS